MAYDKDKQLAFVNTHTAKWWAIAIRKFGTRIGTMPESRMNARLTSTAGRAWLDDNICDYSCYLLDKNKQEFAKVIIPHELCHHIASRLYGDNGHGKAWKHVMIVMGLPPDTYHTLESKAMAERNKK